MDSEGTLRALFLHEKSNTIGWATLDRSARGETPIMTRVQGTPVSDKNLSTALWQDEVENILRDAAALRTRMEHVKQSDPKPTCKICFNQTADTAFINCGH